MAMPDQSTPWSQLDSLMRMKQNENASFDPSVQAMLNQNSQMPGQPMPDTESPTSFLDSILPQTPQAGPGSSYRPDFSGMNNLLKKIDTTNTEGYQLQKDEIDRLKNYRDQLPKGPAGVDLTGLMQLADAWAPEGAGKVFTSSYKAPETAQERAQKVAAMDQILASEGGNLSKEQMEGLKEKLTGEVAKLHYGMMGGAKQDQKQADTDQKAAQGFEKSLAAETAPSRSAIGQASNRVYAAQRLNTLLNGVQDPNNLNPQQVHEIAIGLNSLLAPGNPNVTMYEDIVPKSAQGSVANIENYLTNNPGGAGQGNFVKSLSNTINREMRTSQGQLTDYMKSHARASGGLAWAQRNPDLFRSIVQNHIQSAITSSPGNQFGEQQIKKGDVQDGYQFKGGDPSDQKSWEKIQ